MTNLFVVFMLPKIEIDKNNSKEVNELKQLELKGWLNNKSCMKSAIKKKKVYH